MNVENKRFVLKIFSALPIVFLMIRTKSPLVQEFEIEHLNENIQKLANLLLEGAIFIYPTDTIAGIGCVGNNPDAVAKIFSIKQRDKSKPISYAFSSVEMIRQYAVIPNFADPLMSLLPGPLTLVMNQRNDAPQPLYGLDGQTVGVRIPDVPWLIQLVQQVGVPLVTTSANISSRKPADEVENLDPELLEKVDILLSWKGKLTGTGSTVISLLEPEVKVLRVGTIPENKIKSLLS